MFKSITVAVFLLSAVSLTAQEITQKISDGIYAVAGNNSIHGAYTGQLQIIGSQVIRKVRFVNINTELNMNIETIWQGALSENQATFMLKPTNVLTTFVGLTVSDEELKNPQIVNINFSSLSSVQFQAGRDGFYSENYVRVGEAGLFPLWVNQRQKMNARADDQPFIVKLIRFLGVDKVIDWYRQEMKAKEPLLTERAEFINQEQWQIFDPTDFDFYRQNPKILRITNKTINPLSIAEARMRQNAYAPTLTAKADYYDQQTSSMHLNEAGLLELAILDQNGNKIRSNIEGDSCLWTGIYLWSQVMRYQQTQDPRAYENIEKMVKGLLILIDITNDPTEFARTLIASPASENLGSLFIQGKGIYSNLKWIANGNNDMSKGFLIGFASAYKLLKQKNTVLFSAVAAATKKIPKLKGFSDTYYGRGGASGLVALYSEKIDMEALTKFKAGLFGLEADMGYISGIDSGMRWKSIGDKSGNHLGVISTAAIVMILNNFQEKFPDMIIQGFYLKSILKRYKDILLQIDSVNRVAMGSYETITAYALTGDASLKLAAQNALWSLREIPAPRHIGDAIVDLKRLPDWSPSSWPIGPWGGLAGIHTLKPNLDLTKFEQSAYGYPIFETMSWQTTYFWKENPYFVKYQGSGSYQSFSADYLLVYWLARTSGLITAAD